MHEPLSNSLFSNAMSQQYFGYPRRGLVCKCQSLMAQVLVLRTNVCVVAMHDGSLCILQVCVVLFLDNLKQNAFIS